MNKIEPAYVNFEQAKKLKEKGFKELCNSVYDAHDKSVIENHSKSNYNNWNDDKYSVVISRPEHWQVIEWLRLNHDIWIGLIADCDYKFKFEVNTWSWYENEKCYRLGHRVLGETFWNTSSKPFDSPQEATSAAIDYVLDKLI